jgi:hypothetical protein
MGVPHNLIGIAVEDRGERGRIVDRTGDELGITGLPG